MTDHSLVLAALLVGGYLLGSVSSAILACRVLGRPDPRSGGSRNPGATNVLRIAGRDAAIITLAGDVGKGALAVALAWAISAQPLAWALAAVGAFLGHLYPLFFGFRGGKGVATALGALAVATPLAGLLTVATWGIAYAVGRISAASALTAFALAPVYVGVTTRDPFLLAATLLITLLLFWRHRSNIRRLLAGTENS